jgi:flagellar secretion chaperone FliS
MNTMASINAKRSQYNRDAILSATPVRLLTMLYDRLLLDLNRAEAAQLSQNWPVASGYLLHAQAIVAELTSSLKVDAWDGGPGLLGLYTYVSNGLIAANVRRDVERTRECIRLLEPLRSAWYEAAGEMTAERQTGRPAQGRLDIA